MRLQKIYLDNQKSFRIISSRFPPISLFERVAGENDFEALYVLESLTNDRIREEIGNINLIPEEERIYGPGSSFIMAAFTHLNPVGSRFSDGSWGVYYAGFDLETSIAETKYHRARFLSYTNEEANEYDMRVLQASITGEFEDIYTDQEDFKSVYHMDDYTASQEFGRGLKQEKANGVFYQSVRKQAGKNIAIFKPNLIENCYQSMHLVYCWDGKEISNIYEKRLI